MTERTIDLIYEVDEIRGDVRDLDGGQEQLSKRLDRLEEMVKHLAKHAATAPCAAGTFVIAQLSQPL